MTKIVLYNQSEYEIAVGGAESKNGSLILKLVTDDALETVRSVFENAENTQTIRSVAGNGAILMVYKDFTSLDTKSEVDEAYVLNYPEYDNTGVQTKEQTTGRVITLKLNNPNATTTDNNSEFDSIWKEEMLNG